MRWLLIACTNFLLAILFVSILIVTQTQSNFPIAENTFDSIKYDITGEELVKKMGTPHLKFRDKWIYRGAEESVMTVLWKNDHAVQIDLSFPRFVDFKDVSHVEGSGLTALESSKELVESGWMRVGIPEKGIIFQMNRDGSVRQMSWHHPWEMQQTGGDILTILSLLKDLPPYAYVD